MRGVLLALAGVLVLGVAGCGGSDEHAPQMLSDATHVSGMLTAIEDGRPVDGGVTLTVRTMDGKDDPIHVASIFTGQPPTSAVLALQQKVNELKVGDRLTATGARDAAGRFNVERIAIFAP